MLVWRLRICFLVGSVIMFGTLLVDPTVRRMRLILVLLRRIRICGVLAVGNRLFIYSVGTLGMRITCILFRIRFILWLVGLMSSARLRTRATCRCILILLMVAVVTAMSIRLLDAVTSCVVIRLRMLWDLALMVPRRRRLVFEKWLIVLSVSAIRRRYRFLCVPIRKLCSGSCNFWFDGEAPEVGCNGVQVTGYGHRRRV